MSDTCRSRRELLATAAGVSIAAGGLVGGTLGALSDTESDSGSLTTAKWSSYERVSYTGGGTLYSLAKSDSEVSYGVDGVDALGPVESGFAGSDYHNPNVDGADTLALVAVDGTRTTLDTSGKQPPRGKKSILAAATWNGHPLSVYYAGSQGSKLLRIAPGGDPQLIAEPGDGAKAALGAGDINGDGVAEFVFVDGSATIQYIVPASENTTRDITSTGAGPGSNNNYGVGPPVSIDGYGIVVPAVNGSGGLGLIDANGWVEKSLTSGSTASKTAVVGLDFDADESNEIVFVGYTDNYLRYLDGVGDTNDIETIYDSAGDPVPADTKRGVL
jgi:predicted ribosomally synthesized peptide with SipW-like signal peptide